MQARGHTIRRQRKECGYGLRAFARLIGVHPSWLSRIENDKANPSPDVLRRIALTLRREHEAREAIAEITQQETEGSDDRNQGG
jgi:transcriptional regulator with XRE-family HTH domain